MSSAKRASIGFAISELPPGFQPLISIESFWNVVGFTITRMPFDSFQIVAPAALSSVVATTLPGVGELASSGLGGVSFHGSSFAALASAAIFMTSASVGNFADAGPEIA